MMTERIKELVKQAWAERDLVSATRAMDDAFTDKFAELLIKDCTEFIEQDQGSGEALANRLKNHFGIE